MDLFKGAEAAMGMNAETWARHANPWSVYTRISGAVPIFFALFSPHWIGWWSIAAIAAALAWTLINPRLFAAPKRADSWAAKAVLGERAFLNRKFVPVPMGHRRAAWITTGLSLAFALIGVYGLVVGNFAAALAGWHAAVLAKLWFLDRMVFLWEEVKDADPVYQAWSRADWSAAHDLEEAS